MNGVVYSLVGEFFKLNTWYVVAEGTRVANRPTMTVAAQKIVWEGKNHQQLAEQSVAGRVEARRPHDGTERRK